MDNKCTSPRTLRGAHEPVIEGTPRSAMTYTVCQLCGIKIPRGEGLFHSGEKTTEQERSEQFLWDEKFNVLPNWVVGKLYHSYPLEKIVERLSGWFSMQATGDKS